MRRNAATILCGVCLLLLAACGQNEGNASNTPTGLHVTLMPLHMRYLSPLYPPTDKMIYDVPAVQRLYAAAIVQPVIPKDKTINCPGVYPDDPTYMLVFVSGYQTLRTASLEASGCQFLRFSPNDVRMPDSAFLTLFQRTIGS